MEIMRKSQQIYKDIVDQYETDVKNDWIYQRLIYWSGYFSNIWSISSVFLGLPPQTQPSVKGDLNVFFV